PLKPETSLNYSAGFAWSPTDQFNVTVDGYLIDLHDRILLTGNIGGDRHSRYRGQVELRRVRVVRPQPVRLPAPTHAQRVVRSVPGYALRARPRWDPRKRRRPGDPEQHALLRRWTALGRVRAVGQHGEARRDRSA
ncbi:MAG: TonB-dependent receptor, partial [Gemmatimonadetes bacterium]|nr:TonB-dependent receptor [Gemmatimonadota bacterium]